MIVDLSEEFQKIKLCDDNLTEKKQLSGGAIAKKNGDTFEKITNIPTLLDLQKEKVFGKSKHDHYYKWILNEKVYHILHQNGLKKIFRKGVSYKPWRKNINTRCLYYRCR